MAKGKKTGGRKAGTPNKATADVKAIAAPYLPEAVETLVEIMRDPEASPQARAMACKEIIDRVAGKAPQAITGGDGGALRVEVGWKS